jgi:transcription elongation factor GreA
MTRQTHQQKVSRLEQLQRELATDIPRMIAAARELGDLSENADYHAARERQGLAAAEVRALEALLERARLIEDLDITAEDVSVGTEVELRQPDGERRRVWILGQDDNYHGDNVINYRAGLGQSLVGHQIGDTVEVRGETGMETFEILSIVPRLPAEG